MSEPAEPQTTPVVTEPAPAPHRPNRLGQAAAWVGIVAGVVFIVAVVFFSGFILGKHSDGGHRGHHPGMKHESGMMHRGGPPMGRFGPPRMVFPGSPGAQESHGGQGGSGSAPTTAPARP